MKKEGNLEPMTQPIFLSTFKKLNIKDSNDVIEELAIAFQDSKKRVNVALMLDKYLQIYPDTIL